jgi:hypothetical protein
MKTRVDGKLNPVYLFSGTGDTLRVSPCPFRQPSNLHTYTIGACTIPTQPK